MLEIEIENSHSKVSPIVRNFLFRRSWKELNLLLIGNNEFEYRQGSKLKAVFTVFGLPRFRCWEKLEIFAVKCSTKRKKTYWIRILMEET